MSDRAELYAANRRELYIQILLYLKAKRNMVVPVTELINFIRVCRNARGLPCPADEHLVLRVTINRIRKYLKNFGDRYTIVNNRGSYTLKDKR